MLDVVSLNTDTLHLMMRSHSINLCESLRISSPNANHTFY